jgi:hypothetical protein
VLPLKRNLLSKFKGGAVHLSPERLHLHAWFLSGIISDRKAFLKQLPSTSPGQYYDPAFLSCYLVKNRGEKSEWGECIGEHSLPR